MIVNFDFNLEAWVKQLHIEADSLEAAKEKFMNMTLSEILSDDSLVADTNYDITEVDTTILEYDLVVKVTDIEYDFESEDLTPAVADYLRARLPRERECTITITKPTDVEEDLIRDELQVDTSYDIKSFNYEVIAKK
jgi:hypothetical protein